VNDRQLGIPRAKIDTLTAWWETELHSEAERAALRYTEALTRAADTDRDAAFQRAWCGARCAATPPVATACSSLRSASASRARSTRTPMRGLCPLRAIEHRLWERTAGKAEDLALKSELHIEHLLPQAWEEHWVPPARLEP